MIRTITIELDRTTPETPKSKGWFLPPRPNPPPFGDIAFVRRQRGEPVIPVPEPESAPIGPKSNWFPGDVSPSPFQRNLLGNAIVPRVPLRIPQDKDLSKLGEKSNPADLAYARKVDPRSVRFTEIVETVVNSLLRSGRIYSTGNGSWDILFSPRQCTDAAAYDGETYYSTNALALSYKDPGGVVRRINTTP